MKLPARDLAGLSLGIEMVLSVLLMGAAGRFADRHFHAEPALTLLGVVLGAIAGFRQMYRYSKRISAASDPPEGGPEEKPEKPS